MARCGHVFDLFMGKARDDQARAAAARKGSNRNDVRQARPHKQAMQLEPKTTTRYELERESVCLCVVYRLSDHLDLINPLQTSLDS